MQRLSSTDARFRKRVFPVVYFGCAAFFESIGLYGVVVQRRSGDIPFVVIPVLIAIGGYLLMKRFTFDLVDEMWDDGDVLVARNRGNEYKIALTNITRVTYTTLTNPPRVTLTLRTPCELGKEVTFSPPLRRIFGRDPMVQRLIGRIHAIRNR